MASDEETQETELSDKQKIEITKWFLLNSPPGEIQYVAKDIRSVLTDDNVYNLATSEAFPQHNKSHMICLEMPGRIGDVLITSFGELDEHEYLDPRIAQVAIVDHVKQVCIMMVTTGYGTLTTTRSSNMSPALVKMITQHLENKLNFPRHLMVP